LSQVRAAVLLLSLVATAGMWLPAVAAPGDLDGGYAGFGSGGVVVLNGLLANDAALQPDGRIVVAGKTGSKNQLAVARFLPNGQPDTSFDGDGIALYADLFEATDVAIQADGRIVIGGTKEAGPLGEDFQLARLTSNGGLDPTFDGDGWAEDFDPELRILYDVAIQKDGKIVACGNAFVGGDNDFGVTRYDQNGARDNTFGGDGKVTIPFGEQDTCHDIVQQPDGKLLLAGMKWKFTASDFAVARLEPNGAPDGGFDGDGKVVTGFGVQEYGESIALQADGKIVVLGYSSGPDASHIARYLPNGKLDDSLDGDGKLTIPVDHLEKVAIQPDGKLLALGYHESPDGDYKLAIHRRLAGGGPDTTFDFDGSAWLDFGGSDIAGDIGQALVLQPDGRILAASRTALARVWADGTRFDSGGQQTHGIGFPPGYQPGYHELVAGAAFQRNGAAVVAGQLYAPDNASSDAFVSRFTAEGQIDAGFGTNGSARLAYGVLNAANAVVVQPDGKVVIAGYSNFSPQQGIIDFLVVRLLPDGRPDPAFGSNGTFIWDVAGGADIAVALALAPDGKIVVGGTAWNSGQYDWVVARLTAGGALDATFDGDGRFFFGIGASSNTLAALAVQGDGKILVAGSRSGDFAMARLTAGGAIDGGFGVGGFAVNDLGGSEGITALALTPNGRIYAAGGRVKDGFNSDMALAQYTPTGQLATCASLSNCQSWPDGTYFVDAGRDDYARTLDLRSDNQLVAAGCSNGHFAAVQVRTDGPPVPQPFNTDFVGDQDCARGVKFIGTNQLVLAGGQDLGPFSSDHNIALARFETTTNGKLPAPLPWLTAEQTVFMPAIGR